MSDYQTSRKYDTHNGFRADIRYIYNGFLCGHVACDVVAGGFIMLHWTLDGFVIAADHGFDLVHPDNA